jgi:hypothetical protein
LQNSLNRWYDAKEGRWASEDPIGLEGCDANTNRYINNDVTNTTDPSGLASKEDQDEWHWYDWFNASKNGINRVTGSGLRWLNGFFGFDIEENSKGMSLDAQRREDAAKRVIMGDVSSENLSQLRLPGSSDLAAIQKLGGTDVNFAVTAATMASAGGKALELVEGAGGKATAEAAAERAAGETSGAVEDLGKLTYDSSTKSWRSPGGLVYGQGSKQGNRVLHVFEHLKVDPSKPVHSVFTVARNKLLALLDEAWAKRGAGVLQSNGNRLFDINMGRVIGTNGETHIWMIVRDGTSEIITAYPHL